MVPNGRILRVGPASLHQRCLGEPCVVPRVQGVLFGVWKSWYRTIDRVLLAHSDSAASLVTNKSCTQTLSIAYLQNLIVVVF